MPDLPGEMEDSFEPPTSSGCLPSGGESEENHISLYRLHVSKIPDSITESSLRSLFEKCGVVISFYTFNRINGWVIVSYKKFEDACRAIKVLHDTPPLMLKVQMSKETLKLVQKLCTNEIDEENDSQTEQEFYVHGHIRPVPMLGLPPNIVVPQRKYPDLYGECHNTGFTPGLFNLNLMSNSLSDIVNSIAMCLPRLSCVGASGRGLSQPPELTTEIQDKIKNREPINFSLKTIGTLNDSLIPKCSVCEKKGMLKCSNCNKIHFCSMSCVADDIDHLKNCDLFADPEVMKKVEFQKTSAASNYFFVRKDPHVINSIYEFDEFKIKLNKMMGDDTLAGSLKLENRQDFNIEFSQLTSDSFFNPSLGDMVFALVHAKWFRGYVTFKKECEIKIALIDEGVVVIPDALCAMSLEYQSLPQTAVELKFKKNIDIKHLVGEEFYLQNVEIKDNIIGDLGSYGEVEVTPWVPIFEDCIIPAVTIPIKSEVTISSFQTPNSIYVRSADHKSISSFLRLTHDVFRYSLEAPQLHRKPLFNEILCCKYADDGYFYRAQVFKRKDDKYMVSFIDYGNIELVPISDLKPLPTSLKSLPAFAVKIGLKGIHGPSFNLEALNLLNVQIIEKHKFSLSYENGLDEASLLCISTLEPTSLNKSIQDAQSYYGFTGDWDFFTMENLKYEKWQVGQKLKLFGMFATSYKLFYAVDSESATFKSIFKMTTLMNEYCTNDTQRIYVPRVGELCLAKYEDPQTGDENWYRAVFNKSASSSTGQVLLIDYGNIGCIPFTYLRRMAPQFMNFPCPLKECNLYGIPDGLNDEIKESINNELCENSFDGVLMEVVGDVNIIFVPAVNKILSSFGLPVIAPPMAYADIVNSLE